MKKLTFVGALLLVAVFASAQMKSPPPVVLPLPWNAAIISTSGGCSDAIEVDIGGEIFGVLCIADDAATMVGSTMMPDSWDGGALTFELGYVQTAADTGSLDTDVSCQARGPGEALNSSFGAEVAIDDAAVSGSNAIDTTTSADVTCDCTSGCEGGDLLRWKIQIDAGSTAAMASLYILSVKGKYES